MIIINHDIKRVYSIYLVALTIIFLNIDKIPSIISGIFSEAFNIKALGWGIVSSIIIGVQRGIFSSEAGLGTGAVASGTSDTNSPCMLGYIQMLGVYFTTFIICTSTAFIILTSNIDVNGFCSNIDKFIKAKTDKELVLTGFRKGSLSLSD